MLGLFCFDLLFRVVSGSKSVISIFCLLLLIKRRDLPLPIIFQKLQLLLFLLASLLLLLMARLINQAEYALILSLSNLLSFEDILDLPLIREFNILMFLIFGFAILCQASCKFTHQLN